MSNATGSPEEPDFDALFAEDDATPDQQVPTQIKADEAPPAPPQAAPAAAEDGSGGVAAPGDGGEDGGIRSAQPGADTPAAEDWFAALPDDVRERITAEREEAEARRKQVEDRYNALHGRLAPVQQALSDAQRRLAQQQQASPSPAAKQDPTSVADSVYDSETWKQWAEDFPGDAKVLRTALDAQRERQEAAVRQLNEQVQQLAERLGQTEQIASRTVVQTEQQLLEAKHPDWRQLNESDEFWDWFDGWRASQPKSLRAMYYDDSQLERLWSDAEFTSARLDDYKATLATATPPPPDVVVPPAQPESAQAAPAAPDDPRLSMSVAPVVKGGSAVPQAVPLASLSEAEQFDAVWKTM